MGLINRIVLVGRSVDLRGSIRNRFIHNGGLIIVGLVMGILNRVVLVGMLVGKIAG